MSSIHEMSLTRISILLIAPKGNDNKEKKDAHNINSIILSEVPFSPSNIAKGNFKHFDFNL